MPRPPAIVNAPPAAVNLATVQALMAAGRFQDAEQACGGILQRDTRDPNARRIAGRHASAAAVHGEALGRELSLPGANERAARIEALLGRVAARPAGE